MLGNDGGDADDAHSEAAEAAKDRINRTSVVANIRVWCQLPVTPPTSSSTTNSFLHYLVDWETLALSLTGMIVWHPRGEPISLQSPNEPAAMWWCAVIDRIKGQPPRLSGLWWCGKIVFNNLHPPL